jgi:adenylate cyclase
VEIERKFLVREPPDDLGRHPSQRLEQGYLALDGVVELRARRAGRQAVLTLKAGGGLARLEEEFPLGRERFERLWPLSEGRRIVKTRHRIPHDGLTIEVDVYDGDLLGLVVAEVEFGSVEASEAFTAPDWFAEELTGDERYANRSLACDGLPEEIRAFRLAGDEPVGDGVRRIARGQIDAALGDLTRGAEGVHSARKHFKRARSVVRLVRDHLGDDAYRRENEALRDAGRELSGARDSQVMVETLAELAPGDFTALHSALAAEHDHARRQLEDDTERIDDVAGELRAARERVGSWEVDGELATGFERIYRRGRKALKAAHRDDGDEALHDLRKRVKDLWYVSQVVRPAAPKRTKKLARRASDLSDVIGYDHDLAVLQDTARRHAERLTDDERERLDELVRRRRAKLRRRALADADRLYARKPKAVSRRIGLRDER